ncbi:MAG: DinB family protein [Acidobacteria bacterium]|jgi:hypothetical protein|nr:DinB family protein [Acidobacteriota bacterium]
MSISQSLLPEFDHEMATTRKVLERVPDARANWKPHDKSFSMGALSQHIGTLVGWTTMTMTTTEFDMAPPGQEPMKTPPFTSTADLLALFDKNVADARAVLAGASDADFVVGWTLKMAGQDLFTIPRIGCVRTWVMNHVIHHRAQLSVYLRLNDIPVPSMYGPSADEQG